MEIDLFIHLSERYMTLQRLNVHKSVAKMTSLLTQLWSTATKCASSDWLCVHLRTVGKFLIDLRLIDTKVSVQQACRRNV